jgi:hypothetical protein
MIPQASEARGRRRDRQHLEHQASTKTLSIEACSIR